MLTPSRRRPMLLLAAVSVVGVLSMHGLDPVVETVDQTHSGHASDIDTGFEAHGAIGLCVFVAAAATLGLAVIRRLPTREALANLVCPPGRFSRTRPLMTSGSPFLHTLCVLRL